MTFTPSTRETAVTQHETAIETERTATDRIARLERRLARERKAREEAEGIADRRMRELWLTNRDLDQRVAEQTESIKQAYELLERSFAAASRFVSNLSHEMLTPLNGVFGMLELIEQHSHTDTLTGYAATARQSTDRLHKLVRRLLDLVQLSAGLLKTSPRDFIAADITQAIEQRWRIACLQAQQLLTISTEFDPQARIVTDFERLLQVVDEVIENATVHANAGVVSVAVTSEAAQPHDDHGGLIQIEVTDAGPGFTPVDAKGIYDTILHVDTSPGRSTDGAGIGLGLAKELCRALHGTLTIQSSPGAPTTVSIRVPC